MAPRLLDCLVESLAYVRSLSRGQFLFVLSKAVLTCPFITVGPSLVSGFAAPLLDLPFVATAGGSAIAALHPAHVRFWGRLCEEDRAKDEPPDVRLPLPLIEAADDKKLVSRVAVSGLHCLGVQSAASKYEAKQSGI